MFRSKKTREQKVFLAFKISLCNLQLHLQFPLLQHHSHFNHLKDKWYVQLRTLQWLSSKESDCNTGDPRDESSGVLDGEDPLEEEMPTHSSILAWRIHGQRSLVGYSPWGCKESDMTEQLSTVQHIYL